MLARFFRNGSKSAGFSFRIVSMLLCVLIIWDISFAEIVRWDRNRNPFGTIDSSRGFPRMRRAIDSSSRSPSKVRLERRVFAFFRERLA